MSTVTTQSAVVDAPTPPAPDGPTGRHSSVGHLLRLAPFVRPILPRLIWSAVAAGVATLAGMAFPLVIRLLIDGPISAHRLSQLWWPTALLLGLGLTEAGLFWVRRMLAARPTMRVEATMRQRLYDHLQRLPVAFHDRWPTGQLLSRAVSDLSTIRRFLSFGLVFLIINAAAYVIGVVLLLTLSWPLALIIVAVAIPLFAVCLSTEFRYQVLSRRSQDQVGDLATVVEESVLGIRILKAFGRSAHLRSTFLRQARELRGTELSKARIVCVLWAAVISLPEIALGLALYFGIREVANGSMSPGTLVAFFGVALSLRWPLESLAWLMAMANDAATATQRYFEVLDAEPDVVSPAEPARPIPGGGRLTFRNVHFAYPDARSEVLRGFDLDIAPGETVAVVGATGSGKTTLTALVNRLYDVGSGEIALAGVDIRRLDLADLRTRVAPAFEEPTLFSASVRENVLMGRPGSTDEEVRTALRIAQADFVDELPWGLDTRIGEQGLSLSGGQRQRLALARAVIGGPEVLVLDDPLSALDIHTEALVEQALRSVLSQTTALVIAHRASTVMLADRVALMVDGRVAAIGRHAELMRTVPAYRDLLSSEEDSAAAAAEADAERDAVPVPAESPVFSPPSEDARPDGVKPAEAANWRGRAEPQPDEDLVSHRGLKLAARSQRLLATLVRPQRTLVVLAAIAVLCSEVAFLVGPLIVAYGIDHAVPALMTGDGRPVTLIAIAYLGAAVLNAAGKAVFVRFSALATQNMLVDLRDRMFRHVQALSLSFHERYTSGRVISRMTSDLDTLSDLSSEGLDGLISGVLSIAGSLIALQFLDWQLGLITLVSFLPAVLLMRAFQRSSRAAYRLTRTAIASLIVQFTETMNGFRAVLAFRRERRNSEILGTFNEDYARANGDGLVVLAHFIARTRLVGNLTITAVMVVGAVQVIHGAVAVGVLAAFLLYLRRMYDPLDDLAMFYNSYQSASAALEKIAALLDEVPSVREPEQPNPLDRIEGELTFEGVRFGYHPAVPVLHELDMTVPAGQTVAVVGATGAGKSTLAKLVSRFYDPTEGRVLIDRTDVATVPSEDLRRGVVMVTQETFLFSGSVADNIALGKPNATRREIEDAARAIGAAEFIEALPNGYDTDVRKRGGRLSAGQRQLVAFARVFLADPAVLILDEATASLDIPSERAVQRALRTVLADRTAVIIAHRLSTVAIADRVLVMADGRVIEDGSPEALIGGTGSFARLHSAWRHSLV